MSRAVAVLSGLILGVALLPAAGVLGAAPVAAAPARELDRQTASFTTSLPGMPSSSEAGRQLRRVEVEVVHRRSQPGVHLQAAVTLRGAPSGNPDSRIHLGLGHASGSSCGISLTARASAGVWAADGVEVRRAGATHPAPARLWDCAVVLLTHADDPDTVYDAMGGRLSNHYVQPRLRVAAVEVLGKKQKRLRLVPRATQQHTVRIANTGHLAARKVVITGRGKGVRVRRTVVGPVGERSTVTAQVPITLTGKAKRTKVRLTVRGLGTNTASRVLPIRRIKAPARPQAGRWRSTDKTFTFRIRNGAITGFRGVNMRMRCSSPGSYPTYRNVSLTFPRTKVPRHGIVSATRRYRKGGVSYSVSLDAKVTGKRLSAGRFRYATGPCSLVEGFSAKRIGR